MFPPPGGIIDLGALAGASGGQRLQIVGSNVYASKCFIPARPYTLVSEAVCAELAILLDLPIPGYRQIAFQGKLWFGLEWRAEGRDLKPGMESNLTNLDVVPAMFAFDVLVCNPDRNRGNIVFQKVSPTLERYRLQMIDHSHALGGDRANMDDFIKSVKDPQTYLQYWPELRATVTAKAQFEPFLQRVEALTRPQVEEIVDTVAAEWRPNPDQTPSLTGFLLQRATQLRSLMSQVGALFPNLH
jgi:hypothetical protein